MTRYSQQCKDKLKLISQVKDKKMRQKMLEVMMDDSLFKSIQEMIIRCSDNFENLSTKQKKDLVKNEKRMKSFLKSKYSKFNKRRIVNQVGGFWSALIPIGISLAAELLK